MNKILDYLNKGISDLHPYEPGRSIDDVIAEYKPEKVVKLASNENPLGASPKAIKALETASGSLHLYPDGDSKNLKLFLFLFSNSAGLSITHSVNLWSGYHYF